MQKISPYYYFNIGMSNINDINKIKPENKDIIKKLDEIKENNYLYTKDLQKNVFTNVGLLFDSYI